MVPQRQRLGGWGQRGGVKCHRSAQVARPWIRYCTKHVLSFPRSRLSRSLRFREVTNPTPPKQPDFRATPCSLLEAWGHWEHASLASEFPPTSVNFLSPSASAALCVEVDLCLGVPGTLSEMLTQDLRLPGSQPSCSEPPTSVGPCLLVTQKERIQYGGRNTGRDGDDDQYTTVWGVVSDGSHAMGSSEKQRKEGRCPGS